jgi:hypothetical protein
MIIYTCSNQKKDIGKYRVDNLSKGKLLYNVCDMYITLKCTVGSLIWNKLRQASRIVKEKMPGCFLYCLQMEILITNRDW